MLRRCVTIAVLLVLALLLTQTSHSATGTTAAVQTTPENIAAERNRGKELYRQHKFVDASKVLQKAVKGNKTDDEAWYYLGLSLLPQPKKTKDAAKAFETAIRLRPKFAAARAGLAFALLLRNKPADAIREARDSLSLEPNMADPYYVIGLAHLHSGDRNEALENAEAAIKLNPSLASAYLLKSQALTSFLGDVLILREDDGAIEARKIRYAGAAEALEKYLQLNPSSENKQTWTEQLDSLRFYSSYRTKSGGGERVFSGKEVTTKARILKKPEPAYTNDARDNLIGGTVVLRAVFASDGTVKHLLIMNGLPNGLTEAAIRAARQIKLIPATKDGRPVSMAIQLEYNFNLY